MNANTKRNRKELESLAAALVALLDAPVQVTPTCKISKSRYVAGVQCLKRLHLQVHQPELAVIGDAARAIMDQGTQVGTLARRVFPGGVLVEADRKHLSEALRQTRELLANTEVPAIFEATFEHDGVLVRVDILERRGTAFRMFEVKSSTDVKPLHTHDLGIQKYVLEGSGLSIEGAYVMHLSREYVYDGAVDSNGSRRYDLSRLFAVSEIEPVSAATISRQLGDEFRILGNPEPPEIKPGRQCTDPYECEFYKFCNPDWPSNDVRSLPITDWKVARLRGRGVVSVDQLPDVFTLRSIYHFTEKECVFASSAKENTVSVKPGLASELATIRYPVCYLDFETLWPALPWFRGMRPYDHIVFQWSMHWEESPGAIFRHSEFLWDGDDDPRESFAQALCSAVAGANTIVVYNQTFESLRLAELAQWLPHYREALIEMRSKLWDLLPVVRRNVYDPAFGGSYSLKRVLPALLPGMEYEKLEVSEGSQAGRVWIQLLSTDDPEERLRLRRALLAYCAQDTLALARIIDALAKLAGAG